MIIPIQLANAQQIALLTKIMEGCGHVGMVKTINGAHGLAEILCAADSLAEVLTILQLFGGYVDKLAVAAKGEALLHDLFDV